MTEQIDRDRLRKLADAATPGPWERTGRNGIHTPIGSCIALTHRHDDDERKADAEFIAAARQAVPALLDALEQAEAERDRAIRAAIYAHDSSELMRHKTAADDWAQDMEARAKQAEARIRAVEDVLDKAEASTNHHPAYTFSGQRMDPIVNGADIRRALEG